MEHKNIVNQFSKTKDIDYLLCARYPNPDNVLEIGDFDSSSALVTGNTGIKSNDFFRCSTARQNEFLCGTNARWFDSKTPSE